MLFIDGKKVGEGRVELQIGDDSNDHLISPEELMRVATAIRQGTGLTAPSTSMHCARPLAPTGSEHH